ncbi:hypothetical protein ElyMa_000332000 [Elysia marginata]|uniref:Uncharacterized protein n=1 Tax=Elysia marginata TaxID=1093978 RepID=A0AAV4FB70_9GAST|nr:hypothetical protein ElyMa_000332000 [Elysia marginata]
MARQETPQSCPSLALVEIYMFLMPQTMGSSSGTTTKQFLVTSEWTSRLGPGLKFPPDMFGFVCFAPHLCRHFKQRSVGGHPYLHI